MTARASPPSRRTLVAGIGLMVAGVALFSLNDAVGKWLVKSYTVGELLMFRSLAALCLLAPFIWREGVAAFRAAPRPALQILRVVIASSEVICFCWSVGCLALAAVIT